MSGFAICYLEFDLSTIIIRNHKIAMKICNYILLVEFQQGIFLLNNKIDEAIRFTKYKCFQINGN